MKELIFQSCYCEDRRFSAQICLSDEKFIIIATGYGFDYSDQDEQYAMAKLCNPNHPITDVIKTIENLCGKIYKKKPLKSLGND